MELSKMPKEELELYSYIDLTRMVLEEKGEPQNTPTIFKEICSLLGMSDDEYADKIGDYYTSLTTDKDFVLLDDGNWDLRDHHPVTVILDEDEEIEDEEDLEEIEEEVEEMEEMADPEIDDMDDTADLDDIEDDTDDVDDLTIISEEELED